MRRSWKKRRPLGLPTFKTQTTGSQAASMENFKCDRVRLQHAVGSWIAHANLLGPTRVGIGSKPWRNVGLLPPRGDRTDSMPRAKRNLHSSERQTNSKAKHPSCRMSCAKRMVSSGSHIPEKPESFLKDNWYGRKKHGPGLKSVAYSFLGEDSWTQGLHA